MNEYAFLPLLKRLNCEYAFYDSREDGQPVFSATAGRFPSASVIKVPILLAWIWLERQGLVDRNEMCCLDDEPPVQGAGFSWLLSARRLPFQDVLLLMMALSDNLCTNLVIRRIGLERLNQIFQAELGLPDTELQRKMMDFEARAQGKENWIGAADAVHLYELVGQLAPAERAWFDSMLLACQDNTLLLREIPRDSVDFYHKTGALAGNRIVLNDWGYTDACRVFLFTDRVQDEQAVSRIFSEVGLLALEQ